jgi:tetratricopeptide (TPR) repeat protein
VARAAVKAKQQAKVQAAKPSRARGRGRRRQGGGNPNQQLFFVRLRRGQKWLYALLAVVFAVTFAGVGVGSGGGGLQDLYSGLFGGSGGSSVSKAQDEIKKNPAKGYRDLATAYEQKGDTASAIGALQSYLKVKKTDASAWGELGGLELSQGNTYAGQYQQAQQAAQAADPSAPFQPGGVLATAVGQNPTYQGASQQAASRTSLLYQKATGAFGSAVTDYQKASKIRPRNTTYLQELAQAAVNSGNSKVAVAALRKVLKVDPNTPLKPQIKGEIKQLLGATPTVKSGGG